MTIDHRTMHAVELQTIARLAPYLNADGLAEERQRLKHFDRDFHGNVGEMHAEALDAVTRRYAEAVGMPLDYFAADLLPIAPDDASSADVEPPALS